jgi:hypothetical protein
MNPETEIRSRPKNKKPTVRAQTSNVAAANGKGKKTANPTSKAPNLRPAPRRKVHIRTARPRKSSIF